MATLIVRHVLRWARPLLIFGFSSLMLGALFLLSQASENSAQFGQLYSGLLLFSALGSLLLIALIVYSAVLLLRAQRQQQPGARLTLRLTLLLIVVSLPPGAVVYYFSIQFLQRGIDSWFDVHLEQGLDHALQLSQLALNLRIREVQQHTVRLLEELDERSSMMAALTLTERLAEEASELTLFDQSGRIVATALHDADSIVPSGLPEGLISHVLQGHVHAALDPPSEGNYTVRIVVAERHPGSDEARVLQALFPVSGQMAELAESVQRAVDGYRQRRFLREPLKTSFMLTLSLVLLVSLLMAMWAALFIARRLVRPMRELAEGTHAVAAGRLDQQIDLPGREDELGFLVNSFNDMIRSLATARDANLRSQRLMERQRTYLEDVLARLSSGVMTFDHDGRLRTANPAARTMLALESHALVGHSLSALASSGRPAASFFAELQQPLTTEEHEWRREVMIFLEEGRVVLMCRGSRLPDPMGLRGGRVLVFDDITKLLQAQRDAAWAEVARRLAHEIKNPLTPIQLSAERLRRKLIDSVAGDQQRILDRATHTIIQQVQALKEMVDAFNQYARPVRSHMQALSLNELVREVLYLYRDYPQQVELDLQAHEDRIFADPGRLRQLLHNLVKNAIEAIAEGAGTQVRVSTVPGQGKVIELLVEDDGPGLPSDEIGNLFEPYVTTKPRGTGLGLAIVNKIVEEHSGIVRLGASEWQGARIRIALPLHGELPRADSSTTSQDLQK